MRADRDTRADPYRGARRPRRSPLSGSRMPDVRSVSLRIEEEKKTGFVTLCPINDIIFCLLFYFFSFPRRYSVASKRPRRPPPPPPPTRRTHRNRYDGCFIIITIIIMVVSSRRPVRCINKNTKTTLLSSSSSHRRRPFFRRARPWPSSDVLTRRGDTRARKRRTRSRVAPAVVGLTKFERSGQGKALDFCFVTKNQIKKSLSGEFHSATGAGPPTSVGRAKANRMCRGKPIA